MQLLAQLDPVLVEKHMVLLEKGPILYYAVVVTLLWFATTWALQRSQQQRVDQETAHKAEVKDLLNAERERSLLEAKRTFGQEHVAAGFLRFVEMGALVVKAGRLKRHAELGEEPKTKENQVALPPGEKK